MASRILPVRDRQCCSAMTLADRQAAAERGLTCSAERCARVLLGELRAFDVIVTRLRDGAA